MNTRNIPTKHVKDYLSEKYELGMTRVHCWVHEN